MKRQFLTNLTTVCLVAGLVFTMAPVNVSAAEVTGTESMVTKEEKEIVATTSYTLTMGEETEFEVLLTDVDDQDEKVKDPELKYSVSDEKILKVVEKEDSEEASSEEAVYLKPLAAGTTTLTVSLPEDSEYTAKDVEVEVTVKEAPEISSEDASAEENSSDSSDSAVEAEENQTEETQTDASAEDGESVQTAAEEDPEIEVPVFSACKILEDSFFISWTPVENASGYKLFRIVNGVKTEVPQTFEGQDAIRYTDKDITENTNYIYQVQTIVGDKVSAVSASKAMIYLTAPETLKASVLGNGITLNWSYCQASQGYKIYRKSADEENYSEIPVATISGKSILYWTDTNVGNGACTYMIKSYSQDSESYEGTECETEISTLTAPTITSWKKSGKKYLMKWKMNAAADGYEINYATSALFIGKQGEDIKNNTTVSFTISNPKKKTLYGRIRAYKYLGDVDGDGQENDPDDYIYSNWTVTSNVSGSKTSTTAVARDSSKAVINLRALANQDNEGPYNVMQGGCTDGTYYYYALAQSATTATDSMAVIAKVRLSDNKLIATSEPIDLDHANDMTFGHDSELGQNVLYVVNNTNKRRCITKVDPESLTIVGTKYISATGTAAESIPLDGICNLACVNNDKNGNVKYVATVSRSTSLKSGEGHDILLLDADMNVIRYIDIKDDQTSYDYQGIDATENYILVAMSSMASGKKVNYLRVYDYSGRCINKIRVNTTYEVEHVFHINGQFYVGCHRSIYVTVKNKVPVYKTRTKKVTRTEEITVVDENGDPVMEPVLDENGNPVYKEDGTPEMKEKTTTKKITETVKEKYIYKYKTVSKKVLTKYPIYYKVTF